ncbi:MAG TPA: hypothetical protein VJ836_07015 [Candidatus Saccharimonadales bacterium]|nr:hypothetical protein [Candidatus Saccharimonadales bacterium]
MNPVPPNHYNTAPDPNPQTTEAFIENRLHDVLATGGDPTAIENLAQTVTEDRDSFAAAVRTTETATAQAATGDHNAQVCAEVLRDVIDPAIPRPEHAYTSEALELAPNPEMHDAIAALNRVGRDWQRFVPWRDAKVQEANNQAEADPRYGPLRDHIQSDFGKKEREILARRDAQIERIDKILEHDPGQSQVLFNHVRELTNGATAGLERLEAAERALGGSSDAGYARMGAGQRAVHSAEEARRAGAGTPGSRPRGAENETLTLVYDAMGRRFTFNGKVPRWRRQDASGNPDYDNADTLAERAQAVLAEHARFAARDNAGQEAAVGKLAYAATEQTRTRLSRDEQEQVALLAFYADEDGVLDKLDNLDRPEERDEDMQLDLDRLVAEANDDVLDAIGHMARQPSKWREQQGNDSQVIRNNEAEEFAAVRGLHGLYRFRAELQTELDAIAQYTHGRGPGLPGSRRMHRPLRYNFLVSMDQQVCTAINQLNYLRLQERIAQTHPVPGIAPNFHGRRPIQYAEDGGIDIEERNGTIRLYADGSYSAPDTHGNMVRQNPDGTPWTEPLPLAVRQQPESYDEITQAGRAATEDWLHNRLDTLRNAIINDRNTMRHSPDLAIGTERDHRMFRRNLRTMEESVARIERILNDARFTPSRPAPARRGESQEARDLSVVADAMVNEWHRDQLNPELRQLAAASAGVAYDRLNQDLGAAFQTYRELQTEMDAAQQRRSEARAEQGALTTELHALASGDPGRDKINNRLHELDGIINDESMGIADLSPRLGQATRNLHTVNAINNRLLYTRSFLLADGSPNTPRIMPDGAVRLQGTVNGTRGDWVLSRDGSALYLDNQGRPTRLFRPSGAPV